MEKQMKEDIIIYLMSQGYTRQQAEESAKIYVNQMTTNCIL